MLFSIHLILLLPPLLFLVVLFVSSSWADRRKAVLKSYTLYSAWSGFLIAIGGAIAHLILPTQWWRNSPVPGVHFDNLAALLFLLVAFLGLVVLKFSLNYLDGDPRQGRFLRWMAINLGFVEILVISGNLIIFISAWVGISLSLHKLLLFYGTRPVASRAAAKKFLISRIGDIALIGATLLTWRTFGTLDFRDLFLLAEEMRGAEIPLEVSLSGFLFVLGALLKSAQFPFHTWLPETMDTPTPVSALMHAGIVNAGGFLIVRLSPLIILVPSALETLALIGGLTAVLASVIMLTQTNVKRQLAFSTIAQMGFMMLQCGLGAFSLAMLHLVAHSLYKGHAFLSCGSVIDQARRLGAKLPQTKPHPWLFSGLLLLSLGITLGVGILLGVSPEEKPGLFILGGILVMALTQLIWNAMGGGFSVITLIRATSAAALVCLSYFILFFLFDLLLEEAIPPYYPDASGFDYALMIIVLLAFFSLLIIQSQKELLRRYTWFKAAWVHAYNGFYLDLMANRVVYLANRKN